VTYSGSNRGGTEGPVRTITFSIVDTSNLAPTVSITGPAANAQFTQGDNINITANASDIDGTITKVEFFIGNTLLGIDTSAPYSFAWTNAPLGSSSLTAKATDDKGTATVSAPIAINVVAKPNVAPTVNITGPAANAQFTQGDNISITANASDTDGTITKVEFFNGNTLLGTDTTAPYSYAWTNAPLGSSSLTAKATDDKGTATVSAPIAINVVAIPNVAPTVSITGPAANAQFTQGDNISITANASDTDGTITKVEFFNGNTLLGTDTTAPYSFAWTNAPLGSSSLTAKATDDKGTVTVSASVAINVVAKVNVASGESFTLVNADTNKDMFNLIEGMQIDRSIVLGLNLNVRFNTNPSVVGSVYFTLAGPVNRTRLENAAPYALFGDNNGIYFGQILPVGTYTLTAVTYSESNRLGTEGTIQTIIFSIVDPAVRMNGNLPSNNEGVTSSSEIQIKIGNFSDKEMMKSEMKVYPNPIRDDRVSVKDDLFNSGKVTYMLYSIQGALVQEGTVDIGDYKTVKLDFSQSATQASMYILVIDNENYIAPKRVNLIFQ
jgi:ribosomal protein L21E